MKAYKVSGIEQTPSFATLLGNKIGTFVDREKGSMYSADGSLWFKVNVDVTKLLLRGIMIKLDGKVN